MSENKVYNWRKFTNNKFMSLVGSEENVNEYNLAEQIVPESPFYEFSKVFITEYRSFRMPSNIESKLDELLAIHNLSDLKRVFLITGVSLQKQYLDDFDVNKDDLLNDFDVQYKELQELLVVLKNYLFADKYDLNSSPNITFKPLTSKTVTIKNFFVKIDIYETLCLGYSLTKENFEERSKEIMEATNRLKVDRYSEKVKFDFFHILYKYLTEERSLQRADALRFIGNYFLFFQIRIKSTSTEIELYEDIKDNLEDSDIKNLNHYLTRLPKLYHF